MALNQAETVLDFSQLPSGYIDTPLGKKLAQKGITLANLVELSKTSRANVSQYVHMGQKKSDASDDRGFRMLFAQSVSRRRGKGNRRHVETVEVPTRHGGGLAKQQTIQKWGRRLFLPRNESLAFATRVLYNSCAVEIIRHAKEKNFGCPFPHCNPWRG